MFFPHIISDYIENPRPTFFVNSLENSTNRYIMCEKFKKNWPFWNLFFINLYTSIDRFLISVKYPETLKGNNFKIPRSIFFLIWHNTLAWIEGVLYQFWAIFAIFQCYSSSSLTMTHPTRCTIRLVPCLQQFTSAHLVGALDPSKQFSIYVCIFWKNFTIF
jgi:hypothetical protein